MCIWMLGFNQGRSGASWHSRSVVPSLHTGHHLVGPHREYRGLGLHWPTGYQWDHTSKKTGNPRPCIKNVTFNGHIQITEPSTNTCLVIGEETWQTWLATIRHDMWQLGIELDNIPELAADCASWRGMSRGAMQHPCACSWWWWW